MKEIILNDNEIADVFNNFFSNIKTLAVPQNVYSDLFIGNTDESTLTAIVKYPKHASLLVIKEKCEKRKPFLHI